MPVLACLPPNNRLQLTVRRRALGRASTMPMTSVAQAARRSVRRPDTEAYQMTPVIVWPLLFSFLVAGAVAIVLSLESEDTLSCSSCGYDLHGKRFARCPECGSADGPRRFRVNKPVFVAGLVLVSVPLLCTLGLVIGMILFRSRP